MKQLSQVSEESGKDNGRRICSVLVILSLLWKLKFEYHEIIIEMFLMLYLKPQEVQVNKWTINELRILKTFVPNEYYSELAECLIGFLNLTIERNKLYPAQWLFVLPLIHYFQNRLQVSDTFDGLQFREISQWRDNDIMLPASQFTSRYSGSKSR